jgi:hypothetical protein
VYEDGYLAFGLDDFHESGERAQVSGQSVAAPLVVVQLNHLPASGLPSDEQSAFHKANVLLFHVACNRKISNHHFATERRPILLTHDLNNRECQSFANKF